MATFFFAEQELETVETWTRLHDEAMLCYELGDVTTVMVNIYRQLTNANATWNGGRMTSDLAERLASLHQRWYSVAGGLLKLIADFESDGHEVTDAAELRRVLAEATGYQESLRSLRAGIDDYRAGRAHSVEDLDDILSTHDPA